MFSAKKTGSFEVHCLHLDDLTFISFLLATSTSGELFFPISNDFFSALYLQICYSGWNVIIQHVHSL